MKFRFSLLVLAALITLSFSTGKAQAQGDKIYEKGIKSTVWIVVSKKGTMGSGSLIDYKQRLVLTNYHVVTDAATVSVMFPIYDPATKEMLKLREDYFEKLRQNYGYVGKVLFAEKKRDLALIQLSPNAKLPAGTEAVELADKSPNPGERVHSIGSPGASKSLFVYTPGNCRQVYNVRSLVGSGADPSDNFEVNCRMIETDSQVNQGDSGGPLFNDKGQQIGVTESFSSGRAMSHFVDLAEIKDLLNEHKVKLTPKKDSDKKDLDKKDSDKNESLLKALKEGSKPTEEKPATPQEPEKKDPPKKNAASEKDEKAAKQQLGFIKSMLAVGQKDKARDRINKLLKDYPDTEAAKDAKDILKTIDQ